MLFVLRLYLPHCDEKLLLYHSRLGAHLPRWCRTSRSNGALKALWLPLDKITYRTSAAIPAEYISQTNSLTRLFPSTPAYCDYEKKHTNRSHFYYFCQAQKLRQMTSNSMLCKQKASKTASFLCFFFILI